MEWTERDVDRTTLRNSIHGDNSSKSSSIKSRLGQSKEKQVKRTLKHGGNNSDDGSSFTDSSDDMEFEPSIKKRLGIVKRVR